MWYWFFFLNGEFKLGWELDPQTLNTWPCWTFCILRHEHGWGKELSHLRCTGYARMPGTSYGKRVFSFWAQTFVWTVIHAGFPPRLLRVQLKLIFGSSDSFHVSFLPREFYRVYSEQLKNVFSPSNSTVSPLMTQSLGKRGNAGRWSTHTAPCIRFVLHKRPKKSQTDVSNVPASHRKYYQHNRWSIAVPITQIPPVTRICRCKVWGKERTGWSRRSRSVIF
jgi:hypothetical protein